MNFLFLCSSRQWGGNEKWMHMAANALAERHKVVVAYRRDVIGERYNLPKYKLPFVNEFDIVSLAKIISIVRNERIRILIPTKRKDYVLAGLAAQFTGAKNVLRLGIVRQVKNSIYDNFVYNKLADGIIVNADAIKKILLRVPYLHSEKIRVIHNGLDIGKLESATKGSLPKQGFSVCALGRLSEVKDFGCILRGFAHFVKAAQAPQARLFIIGDGPERGRLEKQAVALSIENQVTFTGFLENPYIYLEQSSVVVSMSRNEGISNAVLEGKYLHNIPVSTKAGGAEEVIADGENGFLIESGNAEQLGEILQKIYKMENTAETANRAHEKVRTMFSMEKMIGEMEAFCEEILVSEK